jgi:hypothetical protein
LKNRQKDIRPEIRRSLSHKFLKCKYYLPANVKFAGGARQFCQGGIVNYLNVNPGLGPNWNVGILEHWNIWFWGNGKMGYCKILLDRN